MPVGHAFDEQAKERVVEQVKKGRNPRTAAEVEGWAWETVKRHLEDDAAFAYAMVEAQDHANAIIEDVLYEEAQDGNLGAIKLWLYNRSNGRWRDEQVLRKEITGADGGPITVVAASVAALREVLTDGDTRSGALSLVRELPAAGASGAVLEDGDPGAPGADGHRQPAY